MLEKELNKLLEEAKDMRQQAIENESASYYNDVFYALKNFLLKKCIVSLLDLYFV